MRQLIKLKGVLQNEGLREHGSPKTQGKELLSALPGGCCGNRGTSPSLHHSAWCLESQEALIGSLLGWKCQSPIICFPNTTSTDKREFPKDSGCYYQEKRREMLNGHNEMSNLGPLAGNEVGSKIWKIYIFSYTPNSSSLWREFQIIITLAITELYLVRAGCHVSFIPRGKWGSD